MAIRGFQSRRRDVLPSRQRDRVVTIQQLTETIGASHVSVSSWTTLVAGMPASRIDVSGQERFRAGMESSRVDTTWEINYRIDMDPELLDVPKLRRLLCGGRYYDIISARQSQRMKLIELVTSAGTMVEATA